ncbi:Cilia- and flagella-associated protein 70 [Podochytrium sp. JEL0797]|nr:Cilia- and flagella-associated protein 70 [Podochytrium sp. JEL0797]
MDKKKPVATSNTNSKAPTPLPAVTNNANLTGASVNPGDASAAEKDAVTAPTVPPGSVLLAVRIGRAANIRGAKGEKVSSFIKVQLADFDYKDSAVVPDTPIPDYNFSHDQIFHVDETLIDIIANKKLSITLIESLPKDKTQILGCTELSLASFLKYPARDPNSPPTTPYALPNLNVRESVSFTYLNPKLLPPPPKEGDPNNQPEITVEVSLSGPLIAPEVVEQGNFLYVKLEDVYPVPDEWTLKEGNEKDLNSNIYSYSVSFAVPAESVPERLVTIPAGSLLHCEAVIPDSPTIGPQPIYQIKPDATPGCTTTENGAPGSSPSGATDEGPSMAIGAPPAPLESNAADSSSAKQSFKKVAWVGAGGAGAGAYVVWIPPDAVVKLRERIVAKTGLEIEFAREMQPKFAHVVDPNAAKYKGKTVIDWASLMWPRVMGLKGRFSLADGGADSGMEYSSGKAKKGSSGKEEAGHSGDSSIYKALASHIGLEIMVEKPLLDKKKLQPITKSVVDFIPTRTMPAKLLYQKRAEMADEGFREQIQEVVRALVTEYQDTLQNMAKESATAAAAAEGMAEGYEDFDNFDIVHPKSLDEEQKRKKKFLFRLNKSGAYFNLKEQLKSSVVNIVRERYRKTSPFASHAELQLLLSELYVYLLDQMHISIHKMFKDVDTAFIDPSVLRTADFTMLKSFADQSELDHDVSVAATYHLERIAKYEDSLQTWSDYGAFCMRNMLISKGVECFKEILARNPKHVPSLLAYGSICTSMEKYEEARVYLVTAVELQPKYVLALTILGLFYEITGEETESEKYLEEAAKIHKATTNDDNPASIMLKAAEFLVQMHATQIADTALSSSLLKTGPSVTPYLLLSRLEIQRGNPSVALENIKSAMAVRQDDPDVWAALGHLQFRQKAWGEAVGSYETVLSLPNESSNMPLIYMRLGFLYLRSMGNVTKKVSERTFAEAELARKAKTMYLRACESKASSSSWLGVAKASMVLGQLDEAEDSLSEANVLNNRDSDVWGYLALLCLMQDRQFEAGQCISQAMRNKIKNPEVLRLVGTAFMDCKQAAPAVECFRIALEIDPKDAATKTLFSNALSLQSADYLKSQFGSGPIDLPLEITGIRVRLRSDSIVKILTASKNKLKLKKAPLSLTLDGIACNDATVFWSCVKDGSLVVVSNDKPSAPSRTPSPTLLESGANVSVIEDEGSFVLHLKYASASALQLALKRPHVRYEKQELKGPLKGINFPVCCLVEWVEEVCDAAEKELDPVEAVEAQIAALDVEEQGETRSNGLDYRSLFHPLELNVLELCFGSWTVNVEGKMIIPGRAGKTMHYLIAHTTADRSTFVHEWAHAVFYLRHEYRVLCESVFRDQASDEFRAHLTKELVQLWNYDPSVVLDEFQAYVVEGPLNVFGKKWVNECKQLQGVLRAAVGEIPPF